MRFVPRQLPRGGGWGKGWLAEGNLNLYSMSAKPTCELRRTFIYLYTCVQTKNNRYLEKCIFFNIRAFIHTCTYVAVHMHVGICIDVCFYVRCAIQLHMSDLPGSSEIRIELDQQLLWRNVVL